MGKNIEHPKRIALNNYRNFQPTFPLHLALTQSYLDTQLQPLIELLERDFNSIERLESENWHAMSDSEIKTLMHRRSVLNDRIEASTSAIAAVTTMQRAFCEEMANHHTKLKELQSLKDLEYNRFLRTFKKLYNLPE